VNATRRARRDGREADFGNSKAAGHHGRLGEAEGPVMTGLRSPEKHCLPGAPLMIIECSWSRKFRQFTNIADQASRRT
jgi:hypothetical protein